MGLLRTLLAISVLFDHLADKTGEVLLGGRLAVQLFYVISGFLISFVLTATGTYRNATGRFYQNRFLRLYPMYIVVAALTLVAHLVLHTDFFLRYAQVSSGADAVLLLSNALLVGQDWVMFMGVHDGHLALTGSFLDSDVPLYEELLVPQAWTLGVELDFYLLAPFVLKSRRRIWIALFASIALRACLIATGVGRSDPWTYRFFPSELALFLLGALSQQILLPRLQQLCSRLPSLPSIAMAALLLCCLAHFWLPLSPTLRDAFVILAFVGMLPLAFIFQGRYRWDRKIGELSYPIYICHMLVILIFDQLAARFEAQHPMLAVLAIVVCSTGGAALLNRMVGVRVERWRQRIRSAPADLPPSRMGDLHTGDGKKIA